MQCKDIPNEPILRLLAASDHWLFWYSGTPNSIRPAFPAGVPDKLVRAKMAGLIRRGLVDGCPCGCRGDYEIAPAGRDWLKQKGG